MTAGSPVPLEYDPIIAKLVAWGADRGEALARMRRALEEYRVGGVVTNIPLHLRVLADQRFQSGEYDTSLLEVDPPGDTNHQREFQPGARAAAVLAGARRRRRPPNKQAKDSLNPWLLAGRRDAMRGRS